MRGAMATYNQFVVFVDSLCSCMPGYIKHVRAQKPLPPTLKKILLRIKELDILAEYKSVVGDSYVSLTDIQRESLLTKCKQVQELKDNLFFFIRIVKLIPLEERGKTML